MTDDEFNLHTETGDRSWNCPKCDALALPFYDLDDNHLLLNALNVKNSLVSNDISLVPNNDIIRFVAECNTIGGNSLNLEDEEYFPTQVNSKYYDILQLNSLKPDKSSSLGLFHVNIASLNLHIDDLRTILSAINFKFDIIGISEHKITKNQGNSLTNIDIPGYHEFVFQPTETSHGGTGFYLKENLNFIERNDLAFNSPGDFETKFIEIKFNKKKDLIIGCLYRHPSSKIPLQEFNQNFLDPVLQKINNEQKQCILMGDFNIDLLKYDVNDDVSLFYNNLSSVSFTPFILQPTRLHSKTLIDNIFFNSLEYESSSGNLLIEISDHLIQFLILEGYIKERSIPEINIFKRDFSNFVEDEFKETIQNLDWLNII